MADVLSQTVDHSLDALLQPKSVAIIGASDDPNRIGGRPVQSTLARRFNGHVYPPHPNRPTAPVSSDSGAQRRRPPRAPPATVPRRSPVP